jgi:rare lipoprotein A
MRLPVERPGSAGLIALGLATAIAGLAAAPLAAAREPVPAAMPSGPAADYPMVLGAPYTVDGITYTPADRLNSDEVGYAAIDGAGGAGVSLAHHTLPLPSYVEVTSLKTGRTILVRVERRGPPTARDLVALSPGAAAQLGLAERTPVRVRRVNPPEAERALLRSGQTAPARMDTPMALVGVLLRKLDPALAPPTPQPAAVPQPAPVTAPVAEAKSAPVSARVPAPPKPVVAAKAAPAKPAPRAPAPASAARHGPVYVQVGAFSTRANAERAARQVGGTVSPAGQLFRVRIAGFATADQAAGALAKARGAGYSDARIQRAD